MRTVLMSVPEASMHKDDGAMFRKHNVGLAGQIDTVDPEAVSELVEERADLPLRRRVG